MSYKELHKRALRINGHIYRYETNIGAYGRKADARREAENWAKRNLTGYLYRITYEVTTEGRFWVVWKGPARQRRGR